MAACVPADRLGLRTKIFLRLGVHAKMGDKLDSARGMPGVGLIRIEFRKVPIDIPAFKPYWGKPTVRNFRGDDGDVGIIRSPVSAIVLPDNRQSASKLPSVSIPIATPIPKKPPG
jgi:hypothetical protein